METTNAPRVTVNGEEQSLPGGEATVTALLRSLDVDPDQPGLAVAVEGEVVRRQDWDQTSLSAGEKVELITAQQGG